MFGGNLTEIELCCKESLIEQVVDRFTDKIHIIDRTDGKFSFRVKALVSEGFVGWIMQFGGDIEVTAPESLRNMIREKIELMSKIY